MRRHRSVLLCMAGTLLTLTWLAGCRSDTPSTAATTSSGETVPATPAPSVTPCAVALTPHVGTARVDQDIIRRQEAVRQATVDAGAHLERLGWAFVAKARSSFDPGFYTLAEQSALCLGAQQPDSAETLLLRGHVLHQMHRFAEAEGLARQVVAQRGWWFDYGLLGDVLMEQGKLPEAVEAYQHMMDQKPGPQAYSRAAHVRWLTGDLTGAIALMQLVTGGGSFHDPEAAAWAEVRLALYAWQAGQGAPAVQYLAAALARQPDYPPALLLRGRMLLAEGQAQDAVAPLLRAAQRNPLPEYQWGLIEALHAAKRAAEAQSIAATVLQSGAVNDRRTFVLYLASTQQHLDTALRLAEEELVTRADVFTLDAYAWTLYAIGRYHEARTVSERALAVGTQEARLFYHAGVIAAAVGQPEAATHWCARAMAIQQMLLPSEREHLTQVSAQVQTPRTALAVQ